MSWPCIYIIIITIPEKSFVTLKLCFSFHESSKDLACLPTSVHNQCSSFPNYCFL